ncbi:hypothetical protein SLA2020_160770 [Shorea laevis]
MGIESGSSHFTNLNGSGTDPKSAECVNAMIVKAYPVGILRVNDHINGEEGESRLEPYVGLEFDSADEAREFYTAYAMRVGFRIRIGQLYRSRSDGSVSSRKYVCSKEGFQLNSRTGCPAFIRVQRRDSGKWVLDQIQKDHNHELGASEDSPTPILQQRTPVVTKSSVEVRRPKVKLLHGVDEGRPCQSGIISFKRFKGGGDGGQPVAAPYAGLDFDSSNEAYQFYQTYAENTGFRVRIGQLFRSKNDGSITSRRFVCSREGFQHPSRVGCGAFMRIKRQDSGTWIVDRLQKDHNHDLQVSMATQKKFSIASKKFIEEDSGGLDLTDLVEINDGKLIKSRQENKIGSNWYSMLSDYFQTKQAEDTGFFYSVEVENGNCMSIFWADGRSRYSCSQFGDAIVFDTSYRKGNCVLPFATFVGVNHHKQPVLLGCALIANESKESFTWLFRTWLRAMSGCHPKSIIADQDVAIQQAIADVLPGTHHRFSMWQFRAKERENLRSMSDEFRYEYEKCIYHGQSTVEFDTAWTALITKYGLQEHAWLKDIYEKRKSWVPLYLRGKFFAGIPVNETVESFFGTLVNGQTPLREFVSRYEQGLEKRREEERKEDFNSLNSQSLLQTREPVEEQCRRLYTLTMFKIIQNELVQSYYYLGIKTHEEGTISRYLVRKCGNNDESHAVTFSAANANISCSCQMFEFEGVLCRHVLKVFSLLNVREIPPHYILHRWTRNAEYGIFAGIESGFSSRELKALMVWSLRETACSFIDCGATSLEKYKLAYEIMREGGKRLCCQR